MIEKSKPKRRSHWQVAAGRQYPRLTFIGGDGGSYECYVVMTKCPHQQTKHWRYVLVPTRADAVALMATWDKERCSYDCQGSLQHKMWRLSA
jgi:hypothetical protein